MKYIYNNIKTNLNKMGLEPSMFEVEDIYTHLLNINIWTDPSNVINQLLN